MLYEAYKANSGAIWFQVRYPLRHGSATLSLASTDDINVDLYQVNFSDPDEFIDKTSGNENKVNFELREPIQDAFKEFWLTWYSGNISLGARGQTEPIFSYDSEHISRQNIDFIKLFKNPHFVPQVEWNIEASPIILPPIRDVTFQDGQLKWVDLGEGLQFPENPQLPKDALIGGFEQEPLYIARSYCRRSLCPGKYVPSLKSAFVAWGGNEHRVRSIEILTGYNAKWVKIKGSNIPENAFIAGYSEVRQEPLYIGRAMHDGCLLVGKVHTLYKSCYLPYKGKEIEAYSFEILVSTDTVERAEHDHKNWIEMPVNMLYL